MIGIYQGIYKKSRAKKFKTTCIFWIFPLCFLLNFLICNIKEREFQNIFLSFSSLFLYIPWVYIYIKEEKNDCFTRCFNFSLDFQECSGGNVTWWKKNENGCVEVHEPPNKFTNSENTFIYIILHLCLHFFWAISAFGLASKNQSMKLRWPWMIITLIILMYSLVISAFFIKDLVVAVVSNYCILNFNYNWFSTQTKNGF